MALRTWIGLVICNLIWSFHPLMGKWLLEDLTPAQGAWMRYTSAFLAYCVGVLVIKGSDSLLGSKWVLGQRSFFLFPQNGMDRFLLAFLGIMTYVFSPIIQMTGLSLSLATENSLIIAMEPLMTAFLAWVVLGERVGLFNLMGFILAVLGLGILTEISPSILISHSFISNIFVPKAFNNGTPIHLLGNFLMFISLIGESTFSILGKKLTLRYDPVALFGSSLGLGVIVLTGVVLSLTSHSFNFLIHLNHLHWKTVIAILWLGPLGTAGGYLYTLFALKEVSVMSLTLLLFLQPVGGAIVGHFILGDRLSSLQNFGGVLILTAVLLPHLMRRGWDLIRRPISVIFNKSYIKN